MSGPRGDEIQIELLRRATPQRRFELTADLTETVRGLAWRAIERRFPDFTREEIAIKFVEVHYGPVLAEGLRARTLGRDRR